MVFEEVSKPMSMLKRKFYLEAHRLQTAHGFSSTAARSSQI